MIRVEDTLAGSCAAFPWTWSCFRSGLEPQADAQDGAAAVQHELRAEGWFLERHPKLAPVSTFTDGVFIAGCCQGPKDIPDTVAQAGAAAAEAMALIDARLRRTGAEHRLHRRRGLFRLQNLHPALPYTAISFVGRQEEGA